MAPSAIVGPDEVGGFLDPGLGFLQLLDLFDLGLRDQGDRRDLDPLHRVLRGLEPPLVLLEGVSLLADLDGVDAVGQAGELEFALLVRLDAVAAARLDVAEVDRRPVDGILLRVDDRSGDVVLAVLGQAGNGEDEDPRRARSVRGTDMSGLLMMNSSLSFILGLDTNSPFAGLRSSCRVRAAGCRCRPSGTSRGP